VIHPSFGNFTWSKKNHTFGGQKGELSLQSPKTEYGPKISMIYPSIENFRWSKKKYIFGGS
jgi:hypothetical protein